MGNQAEEKAESGEAERTNRGTGKAAVRRGREEGNGRNRELSSQRRNGSGRKEAEVRHRPRRGNLKGDHLWNSCGSEAGKDERKPTESQVREPGKKA